MHYLIMEDFSGQPIPFIFPRRVDHVDMREQLPYCNIISCGNLAMANDGLHCSGGNAELGVKARPEEDAEIITKFMCERES